MTLYIVTDHIRNASDNSYCIPHHSSEPYVNILPYPRIRYSRRCKNMRALADIYISSPQRHITFITSFSILNQNLFYRVKHIYTVHCLYTFK